MYQSSLVMGKLWTTLMFALSPGYANQWHLC